MAEPGWTLSNLTDNLSTLLLGKKEIDDGMMEDLEAQLMADVGVEATTEIIDRLTKRVGRKELRDSDAARGSDRRLRTCSRCRRSHW